MTTNELTRKSKGIKIFCACKYDYECVFLITISQFKTKDNLQFTNLKVSHVIAFHLWLHLSLFIEKNL